MNWINVEDRLPDMHQYVLIWTTDYDDEPIANLAHWNGEDEGFLVNGGHRDNDVTHWMPLPEPPDA